MLLSVFNRATAGTLMQPPPSPTFLMRWHDAKNVVDRWSAWSSVSQQDPRLTPRNREVGQAIELGIYVRMPVGIVLRCSYQHSRSSIGDRIGCEWYDWTRNRRRPVVAFAGCQHPRPQHRMQQCHQQLSVMTVSRLI